MGRKKKQEITGNEMQEIKSIEPEIDMRDDVTDYLMTLSDKKYAEYIVKLNSLRDKMRIAKRLRRK